MESKDNLSTKLQEYIERDIYPFHMPGHKRMLEGAYQHDITEIDGFDNLNNPKGLLKELNESIARMYGSSASFFTVNGSTCGNLSAISAVTDIGDTIVVARNCHRSVVNAAILRKLNMEYLFPSYLNDYIAGEIPLSEVKKVVESLGNRGIKPKAVVITSPTYEGVVSDIPKISEYLHTRDIPLIVDSAHGAHLHFHSAFPRDYINCIDICIMSAHKTLPVLNQAAMVHVNSRLVDPANVMRYISMYQTSSPSYVIMESMSCALELITEKNFDAYVSKLRDFYKETQTLEKLSLEPISEGRDMGKIVIYTNGYIEGEKLANILRKEYLLELEMYNRHYLLAMTSVMDTAKGFRRLLDALFSVEKTLGEKIYSKNNEKTVKIFQKGKRRTKSGYLSTKFELKPVRECINRISAGIIMAYPPGIPILMPGEFIENDDIIYIEENYKNMEGIVDGKLPVLLDE